MRLPLILCCFKLCDAGDPGVARVTVQKFTDDAGKSTRFYEFKQMQTRMSENCAHNGDTVESISKCFDRKLIPPIDSTNRFHLAPHILSPEIRKQCFRVKC